MENYFIELNAINVNGRSETKNGLTYLSWPWAWAEIKKRHPDATYTVYERNTEYGPVNYFTDGRTCWVKTGVTINGIEHIEDLPVMDYRNKSIPLESINSMDVNKAIQRSITKACARHGLGLYIYAGEDLPEDEANAKPAKNVEADAKPAKNVEADAKPAMKEKPAETVVPMQKPSAAPQGTPPTAEELADLYDLIPDEEARAEMQERYGIGFEGLTDRRAYDVYVKRAQAMRQNMEARK